MEREDSRMGANFLINGRRYSVLVEPQLTLVGLLRDLCGLSGTKLSCGVGECGACTVLIDGKPTLACSTLALSVREKSILTIEGIADGSHLHAIQRAFIDYGAIQCGFCTPGMIMITKALLDENPCPTLGEVREYLAGNLCRCTGYVKICEAVLAAADAMSRGEI